MALTYTQIYGGNNTDHRPFVVGTHLVHKHGTEEYKITGYKGELMLMKPMNEDGLWCVDTANKEAIEISKQKGYTPSMDSIVQLHYKYADRFKVKEQK